MNTRYPSRQEVLRKQKPELDWIDSMTVRAEYAVSSTPAIRYREIVGEKGHNSAAPSFKMNGFVNSEGEIFDDHYLFMNEAHKHSSDGLKAHYTRLGWGVEKGNRILRELKSIGCIVVNEVRARGQKMGRARRVVLLTEKGKQRLNAYAQQTR